MLTLTLALICISVTLAESDLYLMPTLQAGIDRRTWLIWCRYTDNADALTGICDRSV